MRGRFASVVAGALLANLLNGLFWFQLLMEELFFIVAPSQSFCGDRGVFFWGVFFLLFFSLLVHSTTVEMLACQGALAKLDVYNS